ncbi:hypothetical protein N7E02_16370 [Aliirhizobium terrae]|uniref:hypothetical protein n=1 Tax=Terrirhizobium terrae TaxID=2926709 RepID=UPI002576653E|nr:hypothetical protein [Rhizobium sp. CC-CFT758]WJH41824.1 hypothetical protein N7E02_16370 [Rhizobium sp. CC-CFT758]
MGETSKRDGVDADGLIRTDLEARMVVLEIISMTALALALDTSENGSPEQARGIAALIQDTVRQRCREVGLNDKDQKSANAYADELLSTALVSLYPD